MDSLGLTTGKRRIQDGSEYDPFFNGVKLDNTNPIINSNGTTEESVRSMAKIAEKYKGDTVSLAKYLKASTVEETCANIWDFIYAFIQYHEDDPGIEQIRRPARTWKDREQGVDCDCMSVFVSSILRNIGIPHYFRITKYGKPDFQHVYVIVPSGDSSISGTAKKYITIDGVIDGFNKEKTFTDHLDFDHMNGEKIPIQFLNGLGTDNVDYALEYLKQTDRILALRPDLAKGDIKTCQARDMLKTAINEWNKGESVSERAHNRISMLEKLSNIESQLCPDTPFFQLMYAAQFGDVTPVDVHRSSYVDFNQAKALLSGLGEYEWDFSDEDSWAVTNPGEIYPDSTTSTVTGENTGGGGSSNPFGFQWGGLFNFAGDLANTISQWGKTSPTQQNTGNNNNNKGGGNNQNTGGGSIPIIIQQQPSTASSGMSTTTVLIIAGVGIALVAGIYFATRPETPARRSPVKHVSRKPADKK